MSVPFWDLPGFPPTVIYENKDNNTVADSHMQLAVLISIECSVDFQCTGEKQKQKTKTKQKQKTKTKTKTIIHELQVALSDCVNITQTGNAFMCATNI